MKNHMLSEISQMKSSIMMMQDQIVGQNARTEASEAKIKELTRVKRALERDHMILVGHFSRSNANDVSWHVLLFLDTW